MTRFPVLLVLAAVSATAEQPTLPSELALSQALNLALTNSSTIRTAIARLDEASGRSQQAKSPLLPQLSIGARQAYQTINLAGIGIALPFETTGAIGPFASMDARVFLHWELLNISSIRANKTAHARQDSSRLLVQNARERGRLIGQWFAVPLAMIGVLLFLSWRLGLSLLALFTVYFMLWLLPRFRAMRRRSIELLCETEWARGQNYTPSQVRIMTFPWSK